MTQEIQQKEDVGLWWDRDLVVCRGTRRGAQRLFIVNMETGESRMVQHCPCCRLWDGAEAVLYDEHGQIGRCILLFLVGVLIILVGWMIEWGIRL